MDSTSSDAQIFNTCHLKRKIDDGSIGFPDPAPITQGGWDVPYFILANDVFALKTWLMIPYGRRMLTREERLANYRLSRGRRVSENVFGILVSRFRVMMTTIELPPETVRDVVLPVWFCTTYWEASIKVNMVVNSLVMMIMMMMMCLVMVAWLVLLMVVVTETLPEKPKEWGSSGLARWQNITATAVTSPFQDYQIFQKQLISCACSK